MRSRDLLIAGMMVNQDGENRHRAARTVSGVPGPRARRSVARTPQPRDKGGTHPSRISLVCNVETPMESGDGRFAGRPTATAAELSSGKGWSKKRTLAAERHGEFITRQIGQYPTRKGADVDRMNHLMNDKTTTNRGKS